MKAQNNNEAIYPATVYADRALTKRVTRQDLVGWMKWGRSVIVALWDESSQAWIPAFASKPVATT